MALRSLQGQGWDHSSPWTSSVPKFDQLLELCPNLEYLTASFGPLTVTVSNSFEFQHFRPNESHLKPKLKEVTVHTYMTKKAFMYLWSCACNLEKIKVVNELVNGENLPNIYGDEAEFNDEDIGELY